MSRKISQPTTISVSVSGKYLVIRDLEGASHIASIDDNEEIGSLILEIAKNLELPPSDVGKVEVTEEDTTSQIPTKMSIDDLKNIGLKLGVDYILNMNKG